MTQDSIRHSLGERVKELTALHRTARLLQDTQRPVEGLMREIVEFLPAAWQYPEVTGARVRVLGGEYASANFRETPWTQRARFTARVAGAPAPSEGSLEICYLEARPPAAEGPFLSEERDLIDSLAEMLRMYLQHQLDDQAAQRAHEELERQVAERTAELQATNATLQAEIAENRRACAEIDRHREQLRRLATELALAEERERRAIAADLHDHLGQALAFVKLRLAQFAGDAVFCGFESSLREILNLVDQAIRYTRTLTGELSPPVLYELGLGPALEWMGEQFSVKHGVRVEVTAARDVPQLPQATRVMLFKSAHELLTNAVKHARPQRVEVALRREGPTLTVEVTDDGVGFDPARAEAVAASAEAGTFGLFSIRERLRYLGGQLDVRSAPGEGATVTLCVPLANEEGGAS
jgi:signal transduction histidine kinase